MSSISEYLRGMPSAQRRQLREQVTAAVLAVDLSRRCLDSPGSHSETVAQLRRYVQQALAALHTVHATLPHDL